jgi:hypothetical protein
MQKHIALFEAQRNNKKEKGLKKALFLLLLCHYLLV